MRYAAAILFFIALSAHGQYGQFQSLNVPSGARSAALGNEMVSLADGELMQFVNNPAILDSVALTDLTFCFNPYFAGISVFSGAYYGDFGVIGPLAVGLTYVNYGQFDQTDPTGATLGNFNANDYVITLGKAHQQGPFTMGINLKWAYNSIESYSASALVFDVGGIYRSPVNDITMGLAIKNLGFRTSDYLGSISSKIPFDVQAGLTVKPEHMPFRFVISAYNLAGQRAAYYMNSEAQLAGTTEFFDKIFRRINIGAELILNKSIQLDFAYSHLRHQELKMTNAGGGAGFSYGLTIGIKKIRLRYARATYHAAGGANFISIETNLKSYKKIL
ncbi:type IX secretion system protein PorQ [Marinoscillum sp. MHG1-6]|uniref:type IX secretion system protein PorQ n=1 Tax=Marinoscillum sp. MHG1-6 TaxID=2959627 RepID=UPI0021581262|nr:type IX secretion system protein PorQ [Marinoscillum sp. MHG1-6]